MNFDQSASDQFSEGSSSEESLIRPTYIPKHQRTTLVEQQQKRKEELLKAEKKALEEELRKTKSRAKVAENIRKASERTDQTGDGCDSESGIPCVDREEVDDQLEYEAWKLREIKRLKRDTEEREAHILEKSEILRRRNLTDEERRKEDEATGRFQPKEKPKMKFLQKYYHKGVFYMDVDSIKDGSDVRTQDYVAPTLGDHVDKEKLPKIMQVKNFGKRGRTKYTHLVDQDTSMKDNRRLDAQPHKEIMNKYLHKLGGNYN